MAGQLEQTEDSDDGEELEDVGVLHVLEEVLQHHVAVEGERGHEVYPVERRLEEGRHRRRHDEPHDDLEREPNVADQLHEEEGVVRKGLRFVDGPVGHVPEAVLHGHVTDDRHAAIRVSFQAER